MTPESEKLREAIRQGQVQCHCPLECRGWGQQEHLADCQWWVAVVRVYEIEREQERG